jgi:hypothetical protein
MNIKQPPLECKQKNGKMRKKSPTTAAVLTTLHDSPLLAHRVHGLLTIRAF